jgi:hypothetical protein
MESAERLQKNIGIAMGIIVIFAVGAVTFFKEVSPDIAGTTAITNNAPSSTTSNTVTQNPPPSAPISNRSEDDSSGGEGNEGSSVVPVTSLPKPASAPVIPVATPAIAPKKTASVYTNGTYSATGSYGSPGGQEQLSVTLTLTNDIITAVSVTPGAYDRRSQNYQNAFISGYKQYVLGKNIADVNLTRVSGSSLTPAGFNDALAQIKAQAKA